ncbi:MAG: DNA polymerase Y family protein [Actinomycetota bacterium]
MSGPHRTPGRVLALWCTAWTPEASAPGPAFDQVVATVQEFCPKVEVVRPGLCAISTRGPARYFGGEKSLVTKITGAVTSLGVACRAGIADGLFAAQLAAQAEPSQAQAGPPHAQASSSHVVIPPGGTPAFLAAHPVSVLGFPELTDLLPRLGIWTLGDFAKLSAADAANRFGAQGARAHRLSRGLDPRPLMPRLPPADLSVQLDFEPPAEQSEPVVFAAKTLAEELHAGLAARGMACVRVQAEVTFEDGRDSTRLWRHDGLLSALAVAERVRWQLDSWQANGGRDSARPRGNRPGKPVPGGRQDALAGGIIRLRLVPDQLVRDGGHQLALWGETVISDRVARAANRVQAMLGPAAVTRPLVAGGRDPAEQVTLVPFGDPRAPALPAGRPWPGHIPPPAPATVFEEPRPARVTDDAGVAVQVTGRAVLSEKPAWLSADGGPWLPVTAWAGPWPVTERWWTKADGRRRARFQLVTEDGKAWLAALQDGHWVLEARYD